MITLVAIAALGFLVWIFVPASFYTATAIFVVLGASYLLIGGRNSNG